MPKYFFNTDCSSHWYMVPADKRERWCELNTDDEDDQDTIDAFEEEFSQYRMIGGPHGTEFEMSEEEAKLNWR